MMTQEELKQMRKEIEIQKREIELSKQFLEQKKKLNEIKKRKIERERKEFEELQKDIEIQNSIEDLQIKRVQKRKQNVARMKKALNIDTPQIKRIEAPAPVKEVIVKAVSNSEVVEEKEAVAVTIRGEIENKKYNKIYYENSEPEIIKKNFIGK